MTMYEVLNLLFQSGGLLIGLLSFVITILVLVYEKK